MAHCPPVISQAARRSDLRQMCEGLIIHLNPSKPAFAIDTHHLNGFESGPKVASAVIFAQPFIIFNVFSAWRK